MLNLNNIKKTVQSRRIEGNKAFYIFLFLLVFCCEAKTQTNLIYNGDFEIYSSCPTSESSPFQAPNYEINKCTGWTCPTYGTSDYFNVCATNPTVEVPVNALGAQFPYSGNSYVGGGFTNYTGGAGTDGYNGTMWWEYIQGQFIQPLIANHKYRLSIYVSLAEYSDLCIKEFGAYMSQTPITSPNTAALNVTPQVKFFNSSYFRDTLYWVQVSGEFTAIGGEQYITIGNFNNNMTTDTLRRYYSNMLVMPFVTYFYIDNASILDVTDSIYGEHCSDIIPNVFTPNGDSINELFRFNICDKVIKTSIYNRWGIKIFETEKLNYYWDGRTTSGEECIDGTYYYFIETKEKNLKGFVQLIR